MSKPWDEHEIVDGIGTINISLWKHFIEFICDEMLDYSDFIWRGQASAIWKLEPSLDRVLKKQHKLYDTNIRKWHLSNFKFATRGRRGSNPPAIDEENYWWALGQHHGLATPLLDWTTSPFVAAYFAFCDKEVKVNDEELKVKERAIFALSSSAIYYPFNDTCNRNHDKIEKLYPKLELIEPLTDENPRLVNQGGLFTRSPDGMDIETWVKENFEGEDKTQILIKFILPNEERDTCLRSLNRMNINHLTLFPDLYGASKFCNLLIEVTDY